MPSSSSMLPLLSFHPPRFLHSSSSTKSASSARRHTNSSAAFTASSIASSSCGDDSSAAVMFRRSRRRFFRPDPHHQPDGRPKRKCCSSRVMAFALMPLLPITVFLLTLFLLPVKQARKHDNPNRNGEEPLIRLPNDVIPMHYELHLKVFLPFRKGVDFGARNFTVDGNLRLHLLCRQATNVLMLHAKGLRIDHEKTAIWEEDGVGREGTKVIGTKELTNGRNDLLELKLDRQLLPGRRYILEMGYRANIQRHAQEGGLFQSNYLADGNEKRYLAATQMQPLDARRLLPCFDEPNFKAEFSISVQHPEGTTALSNARAENSRNVERGWTLTLFEKTPKMATYLLALTISDFQHREGQYNGIKIRVWAQPSKLPHTAHALDATIRSLQYFEEYFGIPYPLKKLDIFGVPFLRVTAMENWGLILCRQQNIVYAEGIQAKRDKQFVTDVLSHEIAHMWFGDLVTMEWWDDLWLNEGFATIMGMKAADYAENSTSRMSQLFYDHTIKAFRYDQVAPQAHALSYKISYVSEVAHRFDRITYLKAAAVLRMVEKTVGEELFREGLRAFLRQFKYRNARSDDLLRALSTVETNGLRRALSLVNFSLSEAMDCWTYQTGFPLIRISPLNSTSVIAKQEQFFYLQSPSKNPSKWKVPLFIGTNDTNTEETQTHWLREKGNVILPRGHIIDPMVHGYYRIHYEPEIYQQIIRLLLNNFTSIPLPSRARLIEDSFTNARITLLPYARVFELSEYLVNEREYMPLLVFNNHIQQLFLLLRNHPKASIIKEFMVEILEPMYKRIFSNDFFNPDIADTMREFAMVQLCYWDYAPCIKQSLEEFAKIRRSCNGQRQLSDRECNTIPPELRAPIYSTAILHGTQADYEFLRQKFFLEEYDTERSKILSGLASTKDIKLVNMLLNQLFGARISQEEFYSLLIKYIKSPILNDIVLYMKANFRVFAKKISSPIIIRVVLTFITKWKQTEEELAEVERFEKDHKKELTDLRQMDNWHGQIREIRQNMDFVEKLAPGIFEYLDERTKRKNGQNVEEEDKVMMKRKRKRKGEERVEAGENGPKSDEVKGAGAKTKDDENERMQIEEEEDEDED